MKFYDFLMQIWSKNVVHVSKKWFFMIFNRKSEFSVFISIGKKPSRLTSKKSSQSRRLFTSGSWKKFKMKTLQLFHTCTTFSHPNFVHFHICRPEWKLFSFLKQKWKRFVTKIPKKWKWPKFPPFGFCSSGRDENRFLAFSNPKPCANQCFWGQFARQDSTPSL